MNVYCRVHGLAVSFYTATNGNGEFSMKISSISKKLIFVLAVLAISSGVFADQENSGRLPVVEGMNVESRVYDDYGFDDYGFDDYGFDENGCDENGYDRNGFDRNGFDRNGFNKKGFNRAGASSSMMGSNQPQKLDTAMGCLNDWVSRVKLKADASQVIEVSNVLLAAGECKKVAPADAKFDAVMECFNESVDKKDQKIKDDQTVENFYAMSVMYKCIDESAATMKQIGRKVSEKLSAVMECFNDSADKKDQKIKDGQTVENFYASVADECIGELDATKKWMGEKLDAAVGCFREWVDNALQKGKTETIERSAVLSAAKDCAEENE
ncbi:hypothetical protein GAMM_140003 [Gammaproteobacteria bacterium]